MFVRANGRRIVRAAFGIPERRPKVVAQFRFVLVYRATSACRVLLAGDGATQGTDANLRLTAVSMFGSTRT
jgi:hypothetical protein